MDQEIVNLTELLSVSIGSHILYIYDELERYIENAVTYIIKGIEQGHHILIIENESRYLKLRDKLQTLSNGNMDHVVYLNNVDFYRLYGEFQGEMIVKHFGDILKPLFDQNRSVRTWAHVEWKEQEDIYRKIAVFEQTADHRVNDMQLVSVCAYNGQHITASFQNQLLRSHEYIMTDSEFHRSPLYRWKDKSIAFPSFSAYHRMHGKLKDSSVERQKAEKQVQNSNSKIDSFIVHNLDPILIFNKTDQLIKVNRAFEDIFQWRTEEVIGLPSIEMPFIPYQNKNEIIQNLQHLRSGKDITGYETIRLRKDGTPLNVKVSAFPMRNEDNAVGGWAVIIRDFTEMKHSQALLLQSEKLTTAGQLAAGIAHEIRNPVTTIKGFLQLLRKNAESKSRYHDVMMGEIERIELILNELLILAKPQATSIEINDIREIVSHVVALYEPQALLHNIEMATKLDSGPLWVQCDENQIKQVFVNLVKNAIESMQDNGGKLEIQAAHKKNGQIRLRFKDQGSGMAPEILQNLGQPFYTTKDKGTGLGFMISKKIIEEHQGHIAIESKVNAGTQIDVFLPLHQEGQA